MRRYTRSLVATDVTPKFLSFPDDRKDMANAGADSSDDLEKLKVLLEIKNDDDKKKDNNDKQPEENPWAGLSYTVDIETGHVQLFQTRAQSQSTEQNRSTGFPFSAALCGTFVICCQRLAWIILLSTPNLDCMIMLNGKTKETQPTNDIITPLVLVRCPFGLRVRHHRFTY
ncbi:hypothetical protein RP20_CCG026956 [Aedes albopictus]|nr:hypothetical protein RP20_CCG026956 [Aedes albopictus]